MADRKLKRKLSKLTYKGLDGITKASSKLIKQWGVDALPLDSLARIIDLSKVKTNTSVESVNEYNKNYNALLDSIHSTLKTKARKMGVSSVPLSIIKEVVSVAKSSFIKATK